MKKCLSMKEGCLFVRHIEISQITHLFDAEKPSTSMGVSSWFHNVLTQTMKKLLNKLFIKNSFK
jgi:hypothetical protein